MQLGEGFGDVGSAAAAHHLTPASRNRREGHRCDAHGLQRRADGHGPNRIGVPSWRNTSAATGACLRFPADHGHRLAAVTLGFGGCRWSSAGGLGVQVDSFSSWTSACGSAARGRHHSPAAEPAFLQLFDVP